MLEYGLPLLWYLIIGFGIFMYVLLDGFVLGIGILFPTAATEEERDVMMNSVAPIWDGNETWLVLGGAGLFAAFPLAYAVVLPALYLPLTAMLLALVFRGVAFEFRFKAHKSRYIWNHAFNLGSVIATFAQGAALGAFVQGFKVVGREYAGGAFDWLTPFSIATGFALLAGYALLGATWLIMKTEDEVQQRAYRQTPWLLIAVLGFMGMVSVWVPFLSPAIAERWFSWPNILFFSPAPLFTAVSAFLLWYAVRKRATYVPFILAMALFSFGYSGFTISTWPTLIPPDISLWQAAAPPESQIFLLVGTLFILPVILGYTGYSYWVFRGKITRDAGYHH
ncbi:MAG TPA: cytochrome d ubiquinol oxidase subunit II [Candidatus Binatia bacterium]|nr:cytochrome d ubiquinol oxidase subunit II [Candidatus Binatia bacterium]